VASGGWDCRINFYSLGDAALGQGAFQRTRNVLAHHKPVLALRWQPDGRALLSGGRDQSLKLWEVASPQRPKLAVPLDSPAFAIDVHDTLVAIGVEGGVSVYDLRHSERPLADHVFKAAVHALAFNPKSGELAVGVDDGRALVLRPDQAGALPSVSKSFSDYVRGVAWNGDGDQLLLAMWTSDEATAQFSLLSSQKHKV